ncbi:pilus assembly protein TadG-related protein [Nocardioides lijunqiniae]|uniref:pilus assembly protein TadG-related protein n=1 Tax=Nocardioides lijunqiniae TaxID=2760832 RepID=UPI001877897F|nr:pilus assembly protein TadG-related protein [Nocardioides lijunqiniae]
MSRRTSRHKRDERGSSMVLIIGFAAVLALGVAVVVDASAAYLQRQGLDTLADGAALAGADAGATGRDVYEGGVPDERLELTQPQARAAVRSYLREVGAYDKYPGLSYDVDVDATRITVDLRAPVDLPLSVPGSPDRPLVGASGSAVVEPE